jgi:aryl-alcohol dehydrogenase-like predicted oxidoreductase
MKIVSRLVGMGLFEMLANQSSLKLLDRAYELGSTHWDSADIYDDSEEVIGKW